MIYGLWLSAGGLQASQYSQDIIANNLANLDTAGFKRDLAVFSERAVASREAGGDPRMSNALLNRMSGGTFVAPTYTSFEQGTIETTDRPLDLALRGEGFFTVRDGDRKVYTRDGRFAVDADGGLVTAVGGRPVLNERGAPIRLTKDQAASVRFGEDGTLRVGTATIGQLGIVDFADKTQLRKVGANVLEAPDKTPTKPAAAVVVSRAVETSTVEPLTTMVSMIEASRAYQLNASLIAMQDSMLARTVNDVGRVA